MKSTKVSLDMERQIITNLIVSKQYCTAVLPMLQPKYFKTKYAKVVSLWIREYYNRYEDAPGELIQSIFHEKKDSLVDSEEVDSISEFLISLSDEYDEKKNLHNIDYTIEQAIKYLKLRSIELLKEDLDKALSEGEPVKGEAVIANYARVGKPEGDTIDILHNKMDIIDAFTQEDEILFNLPGVLKQTVGPFRRGDLSAWIAPPKGRKCSLRGTKVLLSTGQLKNIEDIIPNEDQVLAMDGNYRLVPAPVSHLHVNGVQKTYRVTVRTGQSIDITDNHPLFKFMDGWTSISQGLKVGDYIALPKNIPIISKSHLEEYKIKFLAYMLADGCTSSGAFSYTKKDAVLRNEFKECVTLFGDQYKENVDEGLVCIKRENKVCYSRQFLREIKYRFVRSVEKTIPAIIFSLPDTELALFLNRLYSGDGCIYNYGINYCTGSEIMARQIQTLLSRFGIITKLSSRLNTTYNRIYWYVDISDREMTNLFIDKIGFFGAKAEKAQEIRSLIKGRYCSFLYTIPYLYKPILKDLVRNIGVPVSPEWPRIHKILRKGRLTSNLSIPAARHINELLHDKELENLIDGDIYFSPITSIEYSGENETFDITVPKYHNFIANGIVSHNSFALMFVAEQALWAGCRVVFFSLEMRKPQLIRRAWQAWNGQPVKDMIVDIPRFELISGTPGNELFAIENDKKRKTAIDLTDIDNMQDKIRKRFGGGDVRFIALPAYSATVEDMTSHLDNLAWYEDFIPDLVIVDYADIVKPSRYSGTEYRHQLDSIWKGLRALAQMRNIHVCTASQTNRAGMRGDIELEHIAEDMRKLTHVSLLLAINQKPEEREINALRIKTLLNRDDSVFDSSEAVVLQQLALGKFYLDSRLKKEVEKTDVTE